MVTYRIPRDELPYDPASKQSIVEYAQINLQGKTLREACNVSDYESRSGNKGGLGQALEYCFFLYEPNSNQESDFPEAHLELKTTPIKKNKNKTVSAKERLVITMINYNNVVNEAWETSTCLKKMENMLLVSYLHEPGKDIYDFEIEFVGVQDFPPEDMDVIREDWETIVDIIRQGRAHELSSGDTYYLEACTKGSSSKQTTTQPFSDVKAKTRAFALKASYMTAFYHRNEVAYRSIARLEGEENLSLEELVRSRLSRYFGKTERQLASAFNIEYKTRRPKNFYSNLTKAMLGIGFEEEIEEFEKAGIVVKSIRIEENDAIVQSVSFPAFEFSDLLDEDDWEDSDFGRTCESEFLFVVYRQDGKDFKLDNCAFWKMPKEDIEKAKDVWDETRVLVSQGVRLEKKRNDDGTYKLCADGNPIIANNLPGLGYNGVAHVRPHTNRRAYALADGTKIGDIEKDASMLPDGRAMTKQSFWLNNTYVRAQLKKLGI